MRTYHIGFLAPKGTKGDTLVIQAREDIDCLSPRLWQYLGKRETTKRALYAARHDILTLVNNQCGTSFTRVRVD